jgi:large subunit ribosomal protein L29
MKASDLREKTVDELVELEKSLAGDFFKTRLKNFTNQLDDTSAIRKVKRDRARVLTVLAQKRSSDAAPAADVKESPAAPAAAPAAEKVGPKKAKKGEAKK